jgi:site-specific DNA-methyltransferase (adenine-specific)
MYTLYHGNCLDILPQLELHSIDTIIADIPYGTTACKWDVVIPFDKMWSNLARLIKPNSAIVLFSNQPFTSLLIVSNIGDFKYDWIWKKSRPTNVLNAKKQPLRIKEDICIFSNGSLTYNPQNLTIVNKRVGTGATKANQLGNATGKITQTDTGTYLQEYGNYPRNVLDFPSESKTVHPTQKPVALMEYLIKTYSKEGDTILDFTMGSGTTGVACLNTGRNFIGIELDVKYFTIAKDRIEQREKELNV